jgi:hypothetical protein
VGRYFKEENMSFLTILQLILSAVPSITTEVLDIIKAIEGKDTTTVGTPVSDALAAHVAAAGK